MEPTTAPLPRFDCEAYLARIGHHRPIRVDEPTLLALHHRHLRSIPFENFDILLGRPISLAPEDIFKKLVTCRRGGYCFEQNGLFLQALHAFGFSARALLARVHRDGIVLGRGHQLSLVTLSGRRYLADVGFGGPHLPGPMPLILNHGFGEGEERFQLVAARPYGILLQALGDEGWKDLYSFDLGHVGVGDIAYANHYTSTHPASFFTNHRVAALATENGRITLLDHLLRRRVAGREEVSEVGEGAEYLAALRQHFGIDLGDDGHRLPSQKSSPGPT